MRARHFEKENVAAILTEINAFAAEIWNAPDHAAICRLRKGSVKKVLKEHPEGFITSDQCTSMSKSVSTALTEAETKFGALLVDNPSRTRTAKALDIAGSADMLGFDVLLRQEFERSGSTSAGSVVLDREKMFLEMLDSAKASFAFVRHLLQMVKVSVSIQSSLQDQAYFFPTRRTVGLLDF